MDIKKFLKPGKDIVIEIEEVDYLLDDSAVSSIERGDKKVSLIELYGRQKYLFDAAVIMDVLEKDGVNDYLDKRD